MKPTPSNDSAKKTLINCILRQLQKMDMDDLREAYTAISKMSDKRKKNML